jgi:lipopolysaccharide transport system ATP-binding protein
MYSSGMFARLAFAVAINVEPDILIVDEALSVGDIKFQLKCINKFKELQEIGVTILFVSHDIFIVRSFCNKAIWLLNAQVEEQGNVTEVTAHYNEYMHQNNECKSNLSETKKNGNNKNCILVSNFDAINRWGSHKGIIEFVEMYDNNMNVKDIFKLHELITVRMVVNLKDISEQKVSLAISIKDKNGIDLLVSTTQDQNLVINSSNNRVEVYFKFKNYFSSGEYILVAAVEDRANSAPDYLDYIEGAKYFKSEIDEILFGMFHQPVEQIISYRK